MLTAHDPVVWGCCSRCRCGTGGDRRRRRRRAQRDVSSEPAQSHRQPRAPRHRTAVRRRCRLAAWSASPPTATSRPQAARLPQVGDAHALDLERILALRPDLVVALAFRQQPPAGGEASPASGIAVYFSEPARRRGGGRQSGTAGPTGGQRRGRPRAPPNRYPRPSWSQLEQAYRGVAPVKLFYEIWHTPVMTLSGRHFVSDILARCGARQRVRRPAGAGADRVAWKR
ncbi:MAG: hypothetical protein MZW92_64540 [Comamonadaceae bacterium]|nr:hypothetical protein [Comamonadaceae bacterium]